VKGFTFRWDSGAPLDAGLGQKLPGVYRRSETKSASPRARPGWDPKQSAQSRRTFLSSVAETDTLILPIHFPTPTVGFVTADADRFNYRFKRD
jgi:hypothetical protein